MGSFVTSLHTEKEDKFDFVFLIVLNSLVKKIIIFTAVKKCCCMYSVTASGLEENTWWLLKYLEAETLMLN